MAHRERRICLAYGLVAGVGSIWLLGYAMMKIGGSLLQQSQPMAFAMSAWFLGIKLRSRFRRLLGKSSNASIDPDDPDSADAAESPNPSVAEEKLVREPPNTAGARGDSKVPVTAEFPGPTWSEEELVRKSVSTPDLVKLRNVVGRLEEQLASNSVGTSANTADTPEGSGSTRAVEPPKPSSPKKRKGRARLVKRLLGLAAVGGATALALLYLHPELKIKGPFDVLPVHNADVRAGVEGLIEEVCVEEGQTVHQGDLIARLFDRDARAELKKTEAAIEEAQAKLGLLVSGPRPEEIEQARIEVAKDAEAITFATSRLERDRTLYEGNLVSKQALEDSEAGLAQRKSELAAAKSKLDVLLAGSRLEEIAAMKAAITSLETQRSYLEEQLRLMRVVSPASGIVATPARQLMEMKHQLVKKGDLIAKVYELKTITAEMVISERDIADVVVGQRVVLKARAYPEMTFFGKVTSIATAAQVNSSSTASAIAQAQGTAPATLTRSAVAPKTVTITTEIDNGSLFLKPEMTGQAKIFCGERRLIDLLTRRIARTVKVEFWSWW
ncbi:MAG: hypothetical protein DME19_08865 [Verrucomicrobia bacterium]|nr:MAG: hypothetical protein DME19_08865 [Verrucomicrobiota bacterium]